MTDLSALSDQELQALYQPQQSAVDGNPTRITVRPAGAIDLSKMSDADLIATHGSLGATIADVAKSAGVGLAKGVIGLAGLPGDLTELGARGIDYAARGASGLIGQDIPARPQQEPMLGSAQLQRGVESMTGPLYEPKTTAGHYAQTAGEFLPALVGGPETLAAKFATRVAVPALASESAGQLTKGTAAEPFARVAGALVGGAGAAKAFAPKAIAAPTAEELGSAATAAYNHPTVAALELHPSSLAYQAGKIASDLGRKGFRALNAPQTFGIVQELKTPLGKTAKVADVQSVRTALNRVAGNFSNPVEQAAATKAIKGIDDYLANLKPFDIAAGDGVAAAQILNEAKGNYAAKMRVTRTDKAEYRAELNAASSHSGGNINNATRQALKSMLLNDKAMRGFTAEERAMIEKVVKGTATGNIMRRVGKLLSTQGMHGAGVLAGSAAAAVPSHGLSLALPVIGYAAKKIGDASTARAISNLDSAIAMRSPLGQSLPKLAPSTKPLNVGLLSGLLEYQHRR